VKSLEEYAADLLGQESGLFVPSGTMANLISLGISCGRGDEIIIGNKSHIFRYEGGGASSLMGLSFHTVPNQQDGSMSIDDLETAVRVDDIHCPRTALVAIENTQNVCGGKVLSNDFLDGVKSFATRHKLAFHVDGARLFNAAVAMNTPVRKLVTGATSVSICLSKGLGAPIGSVIVSSHEKIEKARRLRKVLGGGMRQAGVIAAAGLYALRHNISRLAEDHENARILGDGIANISGLKVDPTSIQTNMVYFNVECMPVSTFLEKAKHYDVLIGGYSESIVRAVTHLDVTREDIDYTLNVLQKICKNL